MPRILASLALAAALGLAALPAAAADKLSVALDWFVNPDHAPLVVARDKGFFAKAGLDVELIAPADPAAPPRLVAAGQADIAISYQPSLHMAVAENLPLVRFGTLVETPLNTVIVLADGPVKTLKDLKGRKVGYSVSGFEDAVLGAMLESVGLSLKDVELINVNFALTAALSAGQVDAVVGGYRNFELTELDLAGKKGRAFFPEEAGVPPYDELIYVARRDRAADPKLGRFVEAVEAATLWLTNNPDEAWAVFRKADPKLDDDLNRRAFFDTLARFAKRPAALDANRYTRFAAFLKAKKLIDTIPPLDSYAVVPKMPN
ncbi:ABC transporter ATP-binding protein [Prosthecomicrobium hirschii]|uniref:ABC transporter ATP-binding protein n=1 Tax=Prosthecodimorpha hirschii TaxID=665126 RepID=A0A0P6W1T3_9HYPH|nr:ABC transporter substrate-binding protein [Prosthecomicrobium hirschii]KPL52146.1 ABC transporter ATP-binding protein [Prosthecomicrobium hirschii]